MSADAGKIVNSTRPDPGRTRATDRKVVVALAAYRPNVEFLVAQLASIVAQTYPDWRCIITLDSSLEELAGDERLAPYFADACFSWSENRERLGHKRNFEHVIGLAATAGAWAIATCDQDDVWYPEKLEVLVAELARRGPLALVHSDMTVLDGDRRTDASVWARTKQGVGSARPADLLVANVVTGCSMLFDAELARRYPSIPKSFDYHDHWYALAASCHGGVHAVARPLVAYRQHGANVVGATSFDWGVTLPGASGVRGEIDAARMRWRTLRARTGAALAAGLPLSRALVLLYRDGVDLGVVLLVRGLVTTFGNPRLSRYLLRLAVGRLADLLPHRRPDELHRSGDS